MASSMSMDLGRSHALQYRGNINEIIDFCCFFFFKKIRIQFGWVNLEQDGKKDEYDKNKRN